MCTRCGKKRVGPNMTFDEADNMTDVCLFCTGHPCSICNALKTSEDIYCTKCRAAYWKRWRDKQASVSQTARVRSYACVRCGKECDCVRQPMWAGAGPCCQSKYEKSELQARQLIEAMPRGRYA